jgi:RNA polymerase sigma-70 factor (ECF subfamily)
MQLVADYKRSGDPVCIEILFNRYCHLVLAVAMKYLHNADESKDVVLEIFGKLPSDLARYEIKDFGHWIYIVTRNRCYHELKIRKLALPPEATDHRLAEESPEPFSEVDPGGLLMEHLDESLASLREEQRTCIRQFYLEEKSYEEIERETGYSYKQVKSYIQNGKRNLRIYLERFIK